MGSMPPNPDPNIARLREEFIRFHITIFDFMARYLTIEELTTIVERAEEAPTSDMVCIIINAVEIALARQEEELFVSEQTD